MGALCFRRHPRDGCPPFTTRCCRQIHRVNNNCNAGSPRWRSPSWRALPAALESTVSGQAYTIEEKELGVVSVAINFAEDNPALTITDADGAHRTTLGRDHWVRGQTDYQKRISYIFENPQQGIATSGPWTDASTFTAKLCFVETPLTITARFAFAGSQLTVDAERNVAWGEPKLPRIVGTRVP